VERKNKCDTSNNRGNWNHLKIIQQIPKQHSGKESKKMQMSSSYSWRPGMETSGVIGNQVLLGLRNVTAMRQLKADHSLTVKATKPEI
jgi:hypothetical protein